MRKLLFESLLQPPLTERGAGAPTRRRSPSWRTSLERAARRRLGRSLSIREVDAGSCNGCELEIHALNNAFYDLERFGLRFVASPRHADVLLVTGPVTKNMREALERTYDATPDPKWVVAVGDCALDGGMFAGSYAVRRRRLGGRAGRPPHPRLPAHPDRPAQGPAGAGGEGRELGRLQFLSCQHGPVAQAESQDTQSPDLCPTRSRRVPLAPKRDV